MDRKLRIAAFLCISVCMALLSACAAPQAEAPKDLVWPLPPDKPRIKWLKSYSAAIDVQERNPLLESLVGVDVGQSLVRPQGVAVDAKGNIFVADTIRNSIYVFDVVRKGLWFFGEAGEEPPAQPIGITIAPKANLLLYASIASKKVVAYDLNTGKVRFVIGQQPGFFRNPVGVAVDEQRGKIYVTDSKLSELRVFDMSGQYISTVAKGGTKDNELYVPSQVFVDKDGKVYVADTMNFKIKIFGPDGSFIRAFGGLGDTPGHFSRPYGVAVDSEGHIYVSDANYGNVQIFDNEGRLLLTFGANGSGPGLFIAPMHMWIDKDDKVYVTDSLNHRVQVFQYLKEENTGDRSQKSEDTKQNTETGSQKQEGGSNKQ